MAVAVTGRVQKVTCWVPLVKAQSIRRVQGPVQRALALATVHVDVAGKRAGAEFRDRGRRRGRPPGRRVGLAQPGGAPSRHGRWPAATWSTGAAGAGRDHGRRDGSPTRRDATRRAIGTGRQWTVHDLRQRRHRHRPAVSVRSGRAALAERQQAAALGHERHVGARCACRRSAAASRGIALRRRRRAPRRRGRP